MKKFSQLALPYIIWSIIILFLTVLLIAFYAITDSGNAIVNFNFTLQNFVKFFTDPDFLLILWRTGELRCHGRKFSTTSGITTTSVTQEP